MNRVVMGAAAAALAAAGAGFLAGEIPRAKSFARPVVSLAAAAETRATVYYQDPDGRPSYSLTPKKTSDGRDYRAVPASADVSFDEPEDAPAETRAAEGKTERKIKYYRNPMGLPDTSPVPRKDSMGMDYIAVYDGDDTDDGSVRLSLGKIQRTGAKSEPVVVKPIRSVIRAPGTASRWSRCASRDSSKASPM
jgi:membrane fusion protein, copper/silver efflux system